MRLNKLSITHLRSQLQGLWETQMTKLSHFYFTYV